MIGIGLTTYNRPKHLEYCLSQIKKHTSAPYKIHVADDSIERKGIAYRKNECLKELKECDYIFLFDDDCFSIKDEWYKLFIQRSIEGNQHFLYLKETSTIRFVSHKQGVNSFTNCGGAFMFMTKEVVKKVGGFNKQYGLYGYEHAGYSQRIHKAGFTPLGPYLCPQGASDYIYAMDYDHYLPINKELNHKPSISIKEAKESIVFNQKIFQSDISTVYQEL